MAQRPIAISLLLCETMIIEEGTKNVTLVNCFRRRLVEQVPSEPISFTVLAWLTDGQGDMTGELVIERSDDLEEVFREALPIHLPSPLHEGRVRFRVRCSYPTVGGYQVTLFVDGEPIAQCRLTILLRRES